jgi:catalase
METIKKAAASVVHSITDNRATMPGVMTMATGCPIAHNKNSLTAGPTGPVLMQDIVLQEKIGQFAREKIPARNVHALGFGAHGTFTVTNDISKHSYAKVFSAIGKKTEVFVRFSGVFTEQGDPDTIRDLRGFAVKFYTEEGNWDVLCVNTPVFNARDMKVRCQYKSC